MEMLDRSGIFFEDHGNSNMRIDFGVHATPVGCTVNSFQFIEDYPSLHYNTNATLINKFNPAISYDYVVTSAYNNQKLCITTPFVELNSIANELAMYQLYKNNILTLISATCLVGDTGVLFVGSRFSGKSTVAVKFCEALQGCKLLSDNYVHIKSSFAGLACTMWDTSFSKDILSWHDIKKLIIVDLSSGSSIAKPNDIMQYAICMGFAPVITFKVLDWFDAVTNSISPEITIAKGFYRNSDATISKLISLL